MASGWHRADCPTRQCVVAGSSQWWRRGTAPQHTKRDGACCFTRRPVRSLCPAEPGIRLGHLGRSPGRWQLMKRFVALMLLVGAVTGCGEPLVVLGDLPGVMRVVLGTPATGGTVVDTVATRSRLLGPASVAALPNGDILVIDRTRRVIRVTPAGRATLLYLPSAGCTNATCPIGAEGTTTIGDQALLIADNQGNRIWRFDLQSRVMTAIAGNGQSGFAADGTLATAAALSSPTDVAVAEDGRILIAESGADRVRAIGADGRLVTIAGTGEP